MTTTTHRDHAVTEFIHSHDFGASSRDRERRTVWVTGLTIATMAVEIVAGWLTGSMALLADGWHMGTHAAALGIAWAAFAFARRHAADRRFTFGTGKVGILAGFGSSILLGLMALLMFVQSGERLLKPVVIRFDEALLVAGIGLVVNLISAWVLGRPGPNGHDHHHGHAHDHHDDHRHDHNLKAAYLHVLADALTSVFAIAALLAARQWGWTWADPLVGIVGGLIILRWAWGLARETGHILIDGDIEPEELEAIRKTLEKDGDVTVADLHVWRLDSRGKAVIASLVASRPRTPEQYRERLQAFPDLKHISVEINLCAECARSDPDTGRL